MNERLYRWVQVITTQTIQGMTMQLIATTDAEDKNIGIDVLLLKHRLQIQRDFPGFVDSDVRNRWIIFMSADGQMSHRIIKETYGN